MLKVQTFASWAQEVADLTQQPTEMYRDGTIVRLVIKGWPCRGERVMSVSPRRED